MKLMTKELAAKLPPLYSNEKVADPVAIVKYFHPFSNWVWYGCEYDGTDTFYGLVNGHESELGYFSLSELESVTVRGLPIERDLYFSPTPLSKLRPEA